MLPRKLKHLLAPEVIQTSGMDCGPAALKALLDGFDVEVGYDRLREACQTDIDGTSINVLEQLANDLGVETTQQMLPQDAFFDLSGQLSPSLLVTSLGHTGGLHFLVLWSRLGDWMQLMDPAVGRRWVRSRVLERELYIHQLTIDGQDWLEIISQGPFVGWLVGRLQSLGLGARAGAYLQGVLQQRGWQGLCAIDAAARLVQWLVSSKQLRTGQPPERMLEHCVALALQEVETGQRTIPPSYWFARPGRDPSQVVMRGVVMLVPSGRREASKPLTVRQRKAAERLHEPPVPLWAELRRVVQRRDLAPVLVLVGALVLGSLGALAELMIYRASSTLVQRLGVLHQRVAAVVAFAVFLAILLLLDFLVTAICQQLGRQFEGRLRLALLSKIPRLSDSYFRSRLLSDMAQRAHQLHTLRDIPARLQELLRSITNLTVTVGAIILLQPSMAAPTLVGVALSLLVPVVAARWLFELEDRVQTQQGALSRFYLDALAGLVPLRTHGAEQSLVREQHKLLSEWFQSTVERQGALTRVTLLQTAFGAILSVALVGWYVRQGNDPQGLLLMLFWVQRVPTLGQALTQSLSSLAPTRTSLLRLLEPLRGLEHVLAEGEAPREEAGPPIGVDLDLHKVRVVAGGQEILRDVTLHIQSGEHVAIVGRSGAGKSSLLALLLGIHMPSRGRLVVDGAPVTGQELFARLRPVIAWVEPAVQLWNESLLANIQFGSQDLPQRPIAQVVAQSDLIEVLDRLPEGFQTHLGDNGALVSGGEGQRVRLARALLRRQTRLALLDEPFRGLDRERRRLLLTRVRSLWATATMLCVTHDVAETQEFDRVLVVQDGAIIEDGSPAELLSRPSRYRELLTADLRASSSVWAAEHWRRVRVQGGQAVDVTPEGQA